MNTDMKSTHWGFWLIGGLGLVWNLLGSLNFMMQMKADSLLSMPEPFRTLVANRPDWATAAFALGVFGGAIGCVLLLLKQKAAIYVLFASLVGIAVHLMPYLSGVNLPSPFGFGNVMLVFVAPLAVAVFLVWYARYVRSTSLIG
jgi:hypothetical protein